ncbi:hypothetical protein [Tenacibaculum sp. IB213877]|uniref:hypothetical protein n=1 Tax=Tenacibaculum sp. IB213877 TaxID=3097351 RepID=UPI002A5A6C85|nr:hypothetical protein [Tenacibaculum sp. IB213877]MDY0780611.1 hypothetical protein [Tenacibaculum sp. IB213877]
MKRYAYLCVLTILLISFFSCTTNKKTNISKASNGLLVKEEQSSINNYKFSFIPNSPLHGKLKGVVELGASGLNSFIIEMDKSKNWILKKKEYGSSLLLEGEADAAEINSKLRDHIQKIIEYGVSGKEIYFVVSSGAAKEAVTKALVEQLQHIGYNIDIVTPEQEGVYALKSVLPKKFYNTSFVVDMGSGNTKIAYVKDNKFISKETYGTKYYKKGVPHDVVYEDVKKKTLTIPNQLKSKCFLLGGVPYQLAKHTREDDERFTLIHKDLTNYNSLINDDQKKVFSGLNIYKAILDASNVQEVVFDWDANFSIGYLLETPF